MPVEVGNVLNHQVSAFHAKIYVKIWHRHPFWIQKALKQQVVPERIQIRDAQSIGHDRASARTPAGTDRNIILFRPADKLHDNQEVAGKPHLVDDAQLHFEPVKIDTAVLFTAPGLAE